MNKIKFSKMHGAGNDFIVLETSDSTAAITNAQTIKSLCDRHRGIGADGIILLHKPAKEDNCIRMDFFNNDGSRASMCGNGLRCAALFSYRYLFNEKFLRFKTDAAILETEIVSDETVKIAIPILEDFKAYDLDGTKVYKGNTGVPHAVVFDENNVENIDVASRGAYIRNHSAFSPDGANANFAAFVKGKRDSIKIRTFERGVEAETRACGTGIAATALTAFEFFHAPEILTIITMDNDILKVEIKTKDNIVNGLRLTGPAVEIFQGTLL